MADAPFSRPRFALLVLIGVYPLITAITYLTVPLTTGWPIWQRNLVVAPIMVAVIIYGLIPTIHARCGRFVRPSRPLRMDIA
ncbi:hypothetical protein [Frigidibacter sp.]|uniref:hypothetical protein n=1 Tax=Frigidibacter sp. TaxID=2586418 RepID=UPI0027334954|nr:hypothetical protein [Frigidibacter sp.]MDP3340700.1 hypothetical protein [Frigidibacter sp.]